MIQKCIGAANRRGFALIAILWLLVAMAALGLDDTVTTRDALATAQNRMNVTRAMWHAEACGDVVRATADNALEDTLASATAAWDTLDRSLVSIGTELPGCAVRARTAGDRLNVNDAGADALIAAFMADGVTEETADSLADALLDWRDADTVPRPRGAEAAWYRTAGRVVPTNMPFQDESEIRLVRGFEKADSLIALLGVEPGGIVLDRAPLAVIASLPGMTPEAVAHIAELRWRGEPVGDVRLLGASLSEDARARLVAAYPDLVRMIATEPDAWIVRITSTSGKPAISVVEELRLVRAARRAGVTRARLGL
jgi:general secretion pathway protein K